MPEPFRWQFTGGVLADGPIDSRLVHDSENLLSVPGKYVRPRRGISHYGQLDDAHGQVGQIVMATTPPNAGTRRLCMVQNCSTQDIVRMELYSDGYRVWNVDIDNSPDKATIPVWAGKCSKTGNYICIIMWNQDANNLEYYYCSLTSWPVGVTVPAFIDLHRMDDDVIVICVPVGSKQYYVGRWSGITMRRTKAAYGSGATGPNDAAINVVAPEADAVVTVDYCVDSKGFPGQIATRGNTIILQEVVSADSTHISYRNDCIKVTTSSIAKHRAGYEITETTLITGKTLVHYKLCGMSKVGRPLLCLAWDASGYYYYVTWIMGSLATEAQYLQPYGIDPELAAATNCHTVVQASSGPYLGMRDGKLYCHGELMEQGTSQIVCDEGADYGSGLMLNCCGYDRTAWLIRPAGMIQYQITNPTWGSVEYPETVRTTWNNAEMEDITDNAVNYIAPLVPDSRAWCRLNSHKFAFNRCTSQGFMSVYNVNMNTVTTTSAADVYSAQSYDALLPSPTNNIRWLPADPCGWAMWNLWGCAEWA
jgi:hypothetical protein